MAATSTLREYQTNILAKLEEAKQAGAYASAGFLGVVIAGKNVLVNMQEISETLPIMDIYPAPLVKSWFLGMANVRGVLYAVNDIGQLITEEKTTITSNSRILLMSEEVSPHIALLIEKLIGLRKIETMQSVESKGYADFCMRSEVYEDEEHKVWYVLDCNKLIQAKEFIQSY